MTRTMKLPKRSQVDPADTWDLSSLFPTDAAWEKAFVAWEKKIPKLETFRGSLATSAEALAACLKFYLDHDRQGDRLGTYAYLKSAEDTANGTYQRMLGRYRNAASRSGQASSYLQPEIMAIGAATMKRFLASRELSAYALMLEQWLRYKPHTLSDSEEKLLAMQAEMASTSNQVFRQLHNADMKFGVLKSAKGRRIELTHASFATCLQSPQRSLRKAAFHQLYVQYRAHENTLAATLAGSIQRDIFHARARNYESALEASLFHDRVPVAVYDSLVSAVRASLPAVHRYYDLRREHLRLKEIHHYDTYVPLLDDMNERRGWNQAVRLVIDSLAPLGEDYVGVLEEGLSGRWCDRYENQGKQSGAFSAGSFDGDPYILMNYQKEVLDHVFTLAHEAGHSMHSYYSAKHQPYQYHNYTIFVAEVASTFTEQLLSQHLMAQAAGDRQRASLVSREIDSIRATIIRQTMFAEFERTTHALAEANEPLTCERFKEVYRQLLVDYFGPRFALDDDLALECFRIPHFYNAFYVYKYATGLSAAIALADRVLGGGKRELDDYWGFLRGGCSKYPLDLLRGAGVDIERPEPVETALKRFEELVAELERLL